MSKYNITFADIGTTVNVSRGTRIVEVAEKVGASIPFGCKENDCGDCMIEVLIGAENLSKPSPLEIELLKEKLAKPSNRLACQAMVLGDVTVKPA
ncbi:MAG: 2Fe-2S iron-sulfur cluster binding domain-containing protein [Methylophilaceae bacterium]|nr:2Fe-2S iron-sulfur cluster binding domain-containing protein [Methylophilaceae bacterium]